MSHKGKATIYTRVWFGPGAAYRYWFVNWDDTKEIFQTSQEARA